MNKMEKNFSVFSKNDSKNFATEYFLKKIKNNYQVVDGFDLKTTEVNQTPDTRENQNQESFAKKNNNSFDFSKITPTSNDITQNNLTNFDNSFYQPQIDNNTNHSINQNNLFSTKTYTDNNLVDEKHFNNDSQKSSVSVHSESEVNQLEDTTVTDSYDLNVSNWTDYEQQLNNETDTINQYSYLLSDEDNSNENLNKQSKTNMEDKDYKNENNNGSSDYLEKEEAPKIDKLENKNLDLENLLNLYNFNSTILNPPQDTLSDDYFSYLSKKKIKEIVLEKLGYCDEKMLDELHTKSICENWKELDVQKWLLNPENINKFKEIESIANETSNFEDKKVINHLILDNKTPEINQKNIFENPGFKIQEVKCEKKAETENVNSNFTDSVNAKLESLLKKIEDIQDKNKLEKSLETKNLELKKDEILLDIIDEKQKRLETNLDNKFGVINHELKNLKGSFKSSLIEESYKTLLFNNQTEVIKNYINEKLLNVSTLFNIGPKINNYRNYEITKPQKEKFKYKNFRNEINEKPEFVNKNQHFNNSHSSCFPDQKQQDIQDTNHLNKSLNQNNDGKSEKKSLTFIDDKVNYLNKKVNNKFLDISSQIENLEKVNQDKFNELSKNVQELINQLKEKIKVNNIEEQEIKKFGYVIDEFIEKYKLANLEEKTISNSNTEKTSIEKIGEKTDKSDNFVDKQLLLNANTDNENNLSVSISLPEKLSITSADNDENNQFEIVFESKKNNLTNFPISFVENKNIIDSLDFIGNFKNEIIHHQQTFLNFEDDKTSNAVFEKNIAEDEINQKQDFQKFDIPNDFAVKESSSFVDDFIYSPNNQEFDENEIIKKNKNINDEIEDIDTSDIQKTEKNLSEIDSALVYEINNNSFDDLSNNDSELETLSLDSEIVDYQFDRLKNNLEEELEGNEVLNLVETNFLDLENKYKSFIGVDQIKFFDNEKKNEFKEWVSKTLKNTNDFYLRNDDFEADLEKNGIFNATFLSDYNEKDLFQSNSLPVTEVPVESNLDEVNQFEFTPSSTDSNNDWIESLDNLNSFSSENSTNQITFSSNLDSFETSLDEVNQFEFTSTPTDSNNDWMGNLDPFSSENDNNEVTFSFNQDSFESNWLSKTLKNTNDFYLRNDDFEADLEKNGIFNATFLSDYNEKDLFQSNSLPVTEVPVESNLDEVNQFEFTPSSTDSNNDWIESLDNLDSFSSENSTNQITFSSNLDSFETNLDEVNQFEFTPSPIDSNNDWMGNLDPFSSESDNNEVTFSFNRDSYKTNLDEVNQFEFTPSPIDSNNDWMINDINNEVRNFDSNLNEKPLNENVSLKNQNKNYNQFLEDIQYENEKINLAKQEKLVKNMQKIEGYKKNVVLELDDVISSLRDLNIREDSISDIESLKIKFENI